MVSEVNTDGRVLTPEQVTEAVMKWDGGDPREILSTLGLSIPPHKVRLIVTMDTEIGLDIETEAVAMALRRYFNHGVGNIRVARAREV